MAGKTRNLPLKTRSACATLGGVVASKDTPDTLALAVAHYEGASLGCSFRVRELACARADFELARERALSEWWEYGRSEVGRLGGCSENGCFWCVGQRQACGRSQVIQNCREAMRDLEVTQLRAARDEYSIRHNLHILREGEPHAKQVLRDFERDVLGLETRSPVDATFSFTNQHRRKASGTTRA